MNTFQSCRNTADAVPLCLPQNLYLKPIARIFISVQLPQQIETGKSISNWEIMEKLRAMVKPEEFSILKVSKSTLEFIRFEAEVEDKAKLNRTICLIDGKSIQLNAFRQPVKIRAAEAKLDFPNRHAWDSFFRDAKNMDEMKPGERPDTIHFSNLPIKWFVPLHLSQKDGMKPSQRIFQRIFENFGHIRHVDIPICDPYRSKMKEHMTGMKTFTFDQDILFEGYVQFKDYIGFTRTMDAFRGMKLLRKENNQSKTINITVDFDKTKHLSDASIRRRQIVRDRLIAKERDREEKEKQEKEKLEEEEQAKRQRELHEKEEKERRQREREERRKARHFAQLKLKETEELKKRIIKEERKLLKAQRKLEAIRLIGELFSRIKIRKEEDDAIISDIDKNARDEVSKLKTLRERKVKEQRDKLHKTLEGRVVLNSILGDDKHESSSESTTDTNSEKDSKHKHKKKKRKKKKKKSKSHKAKKEKQDKSAEPDTSSSVLPPYPVGDPGWYGCMPPNSIYPFPPIFGPPIRGVPPAYFPLPGIRGRGINGMPGPSRGFYPRRRGMFNPHWNRGWRGRRGGLMPHYTPELEKEYYKYFRKFLEDDAGDRHSSSYSRSRSRSYSRSRSHKRSYSSKSKSRKRSYSRSSSESRSHSRSRYRRSRSESRSKSRNRRSKSRSRHSRSRSHSRSKNSSRSTRRSRSRTRSHSRRNSSTRKSRSHSHSRSKRRSEDKTSKILKEISRSPSYRSIDSSKFISPSRLRAKRSRSKSWSLPRNNRKKSSWSRSPSPLKRNK